MDLSSLQDSGFYPDPSISNIYFSDGLYFVPFKVTGGFIHISFIDSFSVKGDFRISLKDDFNGGENKNIIGNFGISKS